VLLAPYVVMRKQGIHKRVVLLAHSCGMKLRKLADSQPCGSSAQYSALLTTAITCNMLLFDAVTLARITDSAVRTAVCNNRISQHSDTTTARYLLLLDTKCAVLMCADTCTEVRQCKS
jgi:hypothetical protein